MATTLGLDQPFRYRGYVYDAETGWYYLQSRYFSPETCRFISADVLLSTGQGVIGNNSYAYCGNNSVTRTDAFGYSWQNNTGRWITPPSILPLLPSRETIGVCAGLLTQAATDAWNWTAQAATDAWNWTAQAATDAWNWTAQAATDAWNWTKTRWSQVDWNRVAKSTIIAGVVGGFVGAIAGAASGTAATAFSGGAGAPTIPLLMGMGAIDGFAKGALTGMLTCFIEEFFFKGDV